MMLKSKRLKPRERTFIAIGQRVRYIGAGAHRRGDWPEGAWVSSGSEGAVVEYHSGQPEVRVGGEVFEALPPYAVVRWDCGGTDCISPDDEGRLWERIGEAS